jgi:hypothetical protein
MRKASNLRAPVAFIRVVTSGMTVTRTPKIKEITSRQTATIIEIIGIAKTEIRETIIEETVRNTEIPKTEMKTDAATGTASATRTQTTNPTASLWRTMESSQCRNYYYSSKRQGT